MEQLELKLVQDEISEEKHLANIYNKSQYRGWYQHNFVGNSPGLGVVENIFVRFRLPPKLALYGEVIRNFEEEERKVGIHRMLIGEDLKDQIADLLNQDDPQEYLSTLDEETVANLLDKMKNMVLFDCNKIPYLHIVSTKFNEIDVEKEVRSFLDVQRDYLKVFKNVLEEKISIEKAYDRSDGVITNELLDLGKL